MTESTTKAPINMKIEEFRDKKYISELESWQLKYYSEKKGNFDKDEEIANLKIQLMDAQKAVVTYRVLEDRKKRESVMKKHMECLSNISKANDIPSDAKWSYNSETKEILIDEQPKKDV